MGIFEAAHGRWGWGEVAKRLPSLKSFTHIHHTMMKLGAVIVFLNKIEKHMNHVTHTLSSAGISIFSPGTSKFCYIEKYGYRFHFST